MKNWLHILMRYFSLIIGIVCIETSSQLSSDWQIYNGQNQFMSFVIGYSFVHFTILIFEIGCGLFIKANLGEIQLVSIKKEYLKVAKQRIMRRRMSAYLCVLFSIILESYNMMSIVGSQYNSLISSKSVSTNSIQSVEILNLSKGELQSKKKKIETDISDLKNELSQKTSEYKKIIRKDEFKDMSQYDIENLQISKDFSEYGKRFSSEKKSLDDAYEQVTNLILSNLSESDKSSQVEKNMNSLNHGTIYEFLNSIIHIDKIFLQFILTAFPALFLGLISAFSISFFLYGKEIQK